ncbi:tRNA (adenosine(37)-N6)-threonylcarbamoyltransferase complex ATPase subunit type 1 TsaE [soil metagenome]
MRIKTGSASETEAAGAELAGRLGPGDVVVVAGELGAGKTTFVRGACRGLGVSQPVTSPTFTIGQLYRGAARGRPLEVAHLDLYRLEAVGALGAEEAGLLDDYLTPERVAFIEWPRAGEAVLAVATIRVGLEHRGGDRRLLEVS